MVATLSALLLFSACASPAGEAGFDSESDIGAASEELRSDALCDVIVERDHYVDVGDGVSLHVVEKFGLNALGRRPRAMLFLPATLVTSDQWDTDVDAPDAESYNGLIQAAQRGFFAYSVTYEGYGESTLPEDGRTVTAERMLEQMGEVIEWIRRRTRARRVDLVGSSIGSSLAIALGGRYSPIPRRHVGRLVVTSMVYREVTPLFQAAFFNPEVRALLENAPNGYALTNIDAYGIILAFATPEAVAYGAVTFPGVYATGPTLEGFELPVVDASSGRRPLLQIWGDADLVTPASDVDQLAAEYGGRYELAVIAGGGHAPNLEPTRGQVWEALFDFVRIRRGICDGGR